jgi:hypothetical protein
MKAPSCPLLLTRLPTYVPFARHALEPSGRRRAAMTVFAGVGAAVSVLLVAMLRGPVTACLGDYHVSYGIHLHAGLVIVSAYVAATCGAAIFSGYRHIAIFGAVDLDRRGCRGTARDRRVHLVVVRMGRSHQRGYRAAPAFRYGAPYRRASALLDARRPRGCDDGPRCRADDVGTSDERVRSGWR